MLKNVLSLAVASVLLMAGCDRKTDDADAVAAADITTVETPAPTLAEPAPAPEPAPTAAEVLVPSQPEALALLATINDHEIAAAEQARSKGATGAVLEYADLLHEQHTLNQTQTRGLADGRGGMVESAEVAAKKSKGAAELAAMAALEGDAYQKAYIDAMVAGHTEALEAIDTKLIPAATDDAVRGHFTTTRGHIAMHLEEGKRLQTPMQ